VGGPADLPTDHGPAARRWTWPFLTADATDSGTGPESDLARLVAALARGATTTGTTLPHRPWRPPLPEVLSPADLPQRAGIPSGGTAAGGRLRIGLVDRPQNQSQEPLELDVSAGGAWLAVGGPRSGRSTLLRTVLAEAVNQFTPDRLHVHVIDGGGALAADAAPLPHTGTVIAGEDPLRAVRLVDRLGQEVATRRAGPTGEGWPSLLLLIDGVEALSALLDDADPARGSAALLRLIREGAAVGLTCVLTADRAVPGGRLAAVAEHRLVLPLADRADYAVAGIPARAVPGHRPPGRALLGEQALECQLALPRELPRDLPPPGDVPSGRRLRIAELPADPLVDLPEEAGGGPEPALRLLPIGPGGDEGDLVTVDLLRLGGLLVVGPPGSGRSTALDAFAGHLTSHGVPVLRIGVHSSGAGSATGSPGGTRWAGPFDTAAVQKWVDALDGTPGAVIADDVGAPTDTPALAALPAPGAVSGVTLVAASTAGQLAAHFQGPVAALRRSRSGLLLCPGPGETDVVGTRLPRLPLPVRPGSGWLVVAGTPQRVQVARRRTHRAGSPDVAWAGLRQSSSSTGPISWLAYQASSCPSA
jgi:S-DNA-T family DNA segregation ATPase FtsK/SpoIIIE